MQIVIELSESLRSKISAMGLDRLTPGDLRLVSRAISHGTVLPKGHGRLVDADRLLYIKAPIAPIYVGESVHYEFVCFGNDIDKAATLVEADKEERNADSESET